MRGRLGSRQLDGTAWCPSDEIRFDRGVEDRADDRIVASHGVGSESPAPCRDQTLDFSRCDQRKRLRTEHRAEISLDDSRVGVQGLGAKPDALLHPLVDPVTEQHRSAARVDPRSALQGRELIAFERVGVVARAETARVLPTVRCAKSHVVSRSGLRSSAMDTHQLPPAESAPRSCGEGRPAHGSAGLVLALGDKVLECCDRHAHRPTDFCRPISPVDQFTTSWFGRLRVPAPLRGS